MISGDGLIVRIRPHGPAFAGEALATIADLSQRFGNGVIEATSRANLQLRGIDSAGLGEIHDTLRRLGLLDGDAEIEAVRNVVLSPLAGMDDSAPLDGLSLLREIEAGLVDDPELRILPAKFSFVIDEGGRLPLDDIAADIRITASGEWALVSIGGDGATAIPVAVVEPAEAAATALRLARAFVCLSPGTDLQRMRAALERVGVSAILRAAGLPIAAPPIKADRPSPVSPVELYGRQAGFFGIGAPFGSFTAAQLSGLAEIGVGDIRLTPWRALLLPALPVERQPALCDLGFVVDAGDLRLRVAACPGAPACSSGEIATRPSATFLAPLLSTVPGHAIALHVSGCAKGCARSAATPLTLVGRNGRFDLVLDGLAGDRPALLGLTQAQLPAALLALLPAERAMAS